MVRALFKTVRFGAATCHRGMFVHPAFRPKGFFVIKLIRREQRLLNSRRLYARKRPTEKGGKHDKEITYVRARRDAAAVRFHGGGQRDAAHLVPVFARLIFSPYARA